MRLVAVVGLVIVGIIALSFSGIPGNVNIHRGANPPAATWSLPPDVFQLHPSTCDRTSSSITPSASILNLPAAGTGAASTFDPAQLVNNTAVNTTSVVPAGTGLFGSLSTNQYIVLGVADPMNATQVVAAGTAMTSQLGDTVAVPVAILANLTEVYNTGGAMFNSGTTVTYEINHVHGDWWQFTYDSGSGANPITGGKAWENGTYNLGFSVAAGQLCAKGGTLGPSFIVAAFGLSGAGTPPVPSTSVPWAVGVEPAGSGSISYVPAAANAYPQFNTSLGLMGINGHNQNPSLGIDRLTVGSVSNGVSYPGTYASLWGNFKIEILSSSTLSPTTANLAYGGVQHFNATALNQTGVPWPAAKYSWAFSPAFMGTLNTTKGPMVEFTAGSANAAGRIWANVTYNCSTLIDMANITVTPTGGPSINSFTASPNPILINKTTWLNVSGGAWPYPVSYAYAGLPSNCTSKNVSSLKCVPTSAESYPITVYLNDTKGHSSNAGTTLTVYPKLAIVSFAVTPSTLTANTSMHVAVVSSGGIPRITYNYTGLPPGCYGGSQPARFNCTPSAAGKYNVTVYANDSARETVNRTASVIVNLALSIAGFSASPGTIPFGGTVYLNVSVAPGSGTSPYSYLYSALPPGCTSADTATLTCQPTASGSYTPSVKVTDASGSNTSGATAFSVSAPPNPVISSFTASPNPVNVSQKTTLTVTASGGTGSLTYAYTGLPPGCAAANSATIPCTPTSAGTFPVNVTVTDTLSHKTSKVLTLTVTQSASGPLISGFMAAPPSITLGGTTTLTVTATGGVGGLAYAYTGLPSGCTSADVSHLSCTPTSAGNYTVTVFVNDTASHSASASTALGVKPSGGGNGAPSISSFVATPSPIVVGATTNLKVVASGGTTPLSYTFTGLPAGCTTADLATLPCTPTSSGNYTIRVYVNDSAGHSSNAITLLSVTGQSPSSPSSSSIGLWLILVIAAAAVAAAVVVLVVLRKRRPSNGAFPPMQPYGSYPPQQGPPPPP